MVGVILNLAIWLGLHVLFGELHEFRGLAMTVDLPVLSSANILSLLLTSRRSRRSLSLQSGDEPCDGRMRDLRRALRHCKRIGLRHEQLSTFGKVIHP